MTYAKVSEVKEGDVLVADGGFTCIGKRRKLSWGRRRKLGLDARVPGERKIVKSDGGALYVDCDEGKHFLDGQIDDNDEYIGLTKAE